MSQEKAVTYVTWAMDHWAAVLIGLLTLAVAAFIVAALTEWRKKHITKKTEEKVEGWVIQKTLAFFSLLFVGVDYFVPFVQQNFDMVKNVKWVGPSVIAVYGAANFLYAGAFKDWFKSFQAKLEARQAKKASDAQTVQSPQPEPQTVPVPDNPFEQQA